MSQATQFKRIRSLRQRRISERNEIRQQLILRNNLEKRFFRRLNSLFRKFVRVQMFLFREYGIYEETNAAQILNEDFIPLIQSHYRRVFKALYDFNENKYEDNYGSLSIIRDRKLEK